MLLRVTPNALTWTCEPSTSLDVLTCTIRFSRIFYAVTTSGWSKADSMLVFRDCKSTRSLSNPTLNPCSTPRKMYPANSWSGWSARALRQISSLRGEKIWLMWSGGCPPGTFLFIEHASNASSCDVYSYFPLMILPGKMFCVLLGWKPIRSDPVELQELLERKTNCVAIETLLLSSEWHNQWCNCEWHNQWCNGWSWIRNSWTLHLSLSWWWNKLYTLWRCCVRRY